MPNLQLNSYGLAGSITQSGSSRRTISCDGPLAAGLPLKIGDNGLAVELAAGDAIDDFVGVLVKDVPGFAPVFSYEKRAALFDGFIQVPVADGITPKTNDPVFYDPADHVYTNAAGDGLIQLPALFAVDGVGSGVAEIHVFPSLPPAAAASAPAGLTQDTADQRYRKSADKINLTKDVSGALPIANGGTGATEAAAAREALGAAAKS